VEGVADIIQQDDSDIPARLQKNNIFIYYIKMPLNSTEMCVFYQEKQNLTFTNKPTQPTHSIPKTFETQVENNKLNKMMPM
jgi:hypothetical protein